MRKIVSLAAIAALFVSILSGCAAQNGGMREHQGAAVGAGTGAVGGAVVGGLLGWKRGAVVGGLLGALAGGLVGNYHDQQEKNLAETRRAYTETTRQGERASRSSGCGPTHPRPLPATPWKSCLHMPS